MSSFHTIGVIARRTEGRTDHNNTATLQAVIKALESHGRRVMLDSTCAPYLPEAITHPRLDLAHASDLVVVVGGDGTLLDAGRTLAPHDVPLVGVHGGKLGFMVDVQLETLEQCFSEILNGEFVEEPRLMLSLVVEQDGQRLPPQYAVNDVVLSNQASIRMVEFETWQGENFISLHKADGMIVATPTGSTAYALSGGGPVLHPSMQALALVPICPHTLSDRPIVLPAAAKIRIVVRGDARTQAMVTCDGQINTSLSPGAVLHLKQAAHPLRLIHPRRYDFFAILREKLRWGRGPEPLSPL